MKARPKSINRRELTSVEQELFGQRSLQLRQLPGGADFVRPKFGPRGPVKSVQRMIKAEERTLKYIGGGGAQV